MYLQELLDHHKLIPWLLASMVHSLISPLSGQKDPLWHYCAVHGNSQDCGLALNMTMLDHCHIEQCSLFIHSHDVDTCSNTNIYYPSLTAPDLNN